MGTEMTLSIADIERLEGLGHSDFYFTAYDGYAQMKNVDEHCFFLKDGMCSVYKDRPDGCKLYPLVLDMDNDAVVTDDFCPYRHEFEYTEEMKQKLRKLIGVETEEAEVRKRWYDRR